MSRNHSNKDLNAQIAVMRTVASTLDRNERNKCVMMNHIVERTGEAILLLSSYMAYRIDAMLDVLEGSSPFVQKLRNRANHIIRDCDDFAKVFEPYIDGAAKKEAYCAFSDAITTSLDSFFDDMHTEENEPSLALSRRAKLRYHDPYQTDVSEKQSIFEDGYCKGYTACVDDVRRELVKLKDVGDAMAVIDISSSGQVIIKPIES